MRAVVYTEYGAAEVLRCSDVERPVPKEDEILVRVRAVEITKADTELRSFKFPVKWFAPLLRLVWGVKRPRRQVLGGYFAGEVVETGSDVTKFSVGDSVFGSSGLRMGAYGQYVALPESYTIVRKPENMTFEEAAAVPLGGLNALHFIERSNIKPGERVLINGAGGSIGLFGVQIAKARGAIVTGVDHGRKEGMLRSLGVDHFVDYTKEDFTKSGEKYDVIFDMVVGSSYSDCIACLNPGGRYQMGNPRVSDMFRSVITSRFTDKTAQFAFAGESVGELETLKDMIETGTIKSVVDHVYSMEQVAEAHSKVETEERIGSIVMALD